MSTNFVLQRVVSISCMRDGKKVNHLFAFWPEILTGAANVGSNLVLRAAIEMAWPVTLQ